VSFSSLLPGISITTFSPIISIEKNDREYCKQDSRANGSQRWTAFNVNGKGHINDS
jgi:hypothetical protein